MNCGGTGITHEKEESAKEQAKDEGSRKIRVVHNILIDRFKRVQNGKRLGKDVSEIDSEFFETGPE